MLTAGGNFEASLLLLDEVWDQQEKVVAGEIVAAVPSRDVVVFTGSKSEDLEIGSLIVRRNRRWEAFDRN